MLRHLCGTTWCFNHSIKLLNKPLRFHNVPHCSMSIAHSVMAHLCVHDVRLVSARAKGSGPSATMWLKFESAK
eukprot:4975727-Amphidinium_carterae.2